MEPKNDGFLIGISSSRGVHFQVNHVSFPGSYTVVNITDPDLHPPKSFEDLKLTPPPRYTLDPSMVDRSLNRRLVKSRWQ